MNRADVAAVAPMIVLGATATLVVLLLAIRRNRTAATLLTLAGIAAAAATLPLAADVAPRNVTALFIVDRFGLLATGLLLGSGFVVAALAHGYLARRHVARAEELHVALLLALVGAVALAESRHFASLFLGLETLSVGLYVLIAYLRTTERDAEAGFKYLVLAGASSAFLLFGLALLYAELGTMDLGALATAIDAAERRGLVVAGLALALAGLAFKLAVVPFHMWTPDVYAGAPAPVTAFLATASKGAVVALLMRWLPGTYSPVLAAIAAASMLAGNVLALRENSVKRLLAYSSIAHLGYLLVAMIGGSPEAVTFYLGAYFVTTLAAFGVMSALTTEDGEPDAIDAWRGLFWRRPALAAVMTAALLSLAGLPLTAGFIGKLYLLQAGVDAALLGLVLVLVTTSVVGLYAYLRVVAAMFAPAVPGLRGVRTTLADGAVLGALMALLVWLGVWPAALVRLVAASVP